MNKKKLIILGGFSQNIVVVEKAKLANIYTIVVDYLENSPCKNIADESYLISITDVDSLVNLFNEVNADGIMNYCIDPGQIPYVHICNKLGIKSYGTLEQFEVLSNKNLFYKLCKNNDLEVIDKFKEDDINNDFIDYPIVVKPVDGRASKGVRVCYNKNEFDKYFNFARECSKSSLALIEKYIDGIEVCAKYFVINGKVFLTSFSDTYSVYKDGQKVSIIGKRFPSVLIDEFLETDNEKIKKMIRSIGIENGPISLTAFYQDGVFRYFDPSFRLGGAQQWRIEEEMTGFDKSFALTQFALDGKIDDLPNSIEIESHRIKKYGAIAYVIVSLGTIKHISGIDECLNLSTVIGCCQGHYEGETVVQTGTTDQVLVWFHLVSDSIDLIKNDINIINKKVVVIDLEGNDMVFAKFNPSLL